MATSQSPPARKPSAPTAPDWREAIERVLAEPARVKPASQPIVDLERGVAIGYEMLARFDSEIDAPPPTWLAEAERLGLGSRLEAALVEAGLSALDWVPDGCFLAINVSPRGARAPRPPARAGPPPRRPG